MQRIIECLSRRCDHVKKRYPTWISYWRSYIRKISKCWRETCEWTGPFRARNWSMVVLVILTEWSSPLAGGFRGAHTETQVVFVVVRSQRPSHTPPPPHRKLTFFLYLSVSFVFLPPPPHLTISRWFLSVFSSSIILFALVSTFPVLFGPVLSAIFARMRSLEPNELPWACISHSNLLEPSKYKVVDEIGPCNPLVHVDLWLSYSFTNLSLSLSLS